MSDCRPCTICIKVILRIMQMCAERTALELLLEWRFRLSSCMYLLPVCVFHHVKELTLFEFFFKERHSLPFPEQVISKHHLTKILNQVIWSWASVLVTSARLGAQGAEGSRRGHWFGHSFLTGTQCDHRGWTLGANVHVWNRKWGTGMKFGSVENVLDSWVLLPVEWWGCSRSIQTLRFLPDSGSQLANGTWPTQCSSQSSQVTGLQPWHPNMKAMLSQLWEGKVRKQSWVSCLSLP